MAFNPYFPAGYNTYQPIMQQYGMAAPVQQPQTQSFSQPTIHAEIVQINGDEDEANKFPVSTGGTQMMINKTEDKIFIKTVYANNQSNLDVYVKQQNAPAQKQPNFEDFVTWDKLEQRLAQIEQRPVKLEKEEPNE